jgi:hypothetical protein
MSIIKNVSGPYTINTINHDDPIILDSNVVIINGNLRVIGNTTTISSTNTDIGDNSIVLNKGGGGGSGVVLGTAGIQIDRTDPSGSGLANVFLRWNESTSTWQVTNNGTTYYSIVATTTANTRLVDDLNPQLGASLNTAGFVIRNYDSDNVYIAPTSALQLDGNIQIKKLLNFPQPTIVPNYNIITSSNVGTGGTGLYVTNDEGIQNQELITKAKAVVYSIIF